MRKLLALGFLVGACSSVPTQQAEPQAVGVDAAGDRSAASPAGSSAAAAAATSAGANSTGAAAGEGSAGSVSAPAAAGTKGDSGGQITTGGASGAGSHAGGSGGTSAQAGATHEAGSPSVGSQGGAADGGDSSGGAAGAPADPCEGVTHWSPTDKITDYTVRPPDAPGDWQGDLRVFGGILWAAETARGCQTYPGHDVLSGWIEIATCAGGPIAETAACQCSAGACCDSCYLRPQSYSCGEVVRAVRCTGGAEEGDYWNLFCNGLESGDCKVWGVHTKYAGGSCASGVTCQSSNTETACAP